jgi:hypothetical protein
MNKSMNVIPHAVYEFETQLSLEEDQRRGLMQMWFQWLDDEVVTICETYEISSSVVYAGLERDKEGREREGKELSLQMPHFLFYTNIIMLVCQSPV